MRPMANFAPKIKPPKPVRRSETHIFPAPRRGWVRNENYAKHKPEGAAVLDNWFPTATGCRVRAGSRKFATIGGTVTAILPYVNGDSWHLFAADESHLYDVTSPADPNTAPAAAVSGLLSGDWSYTQFSTPGGTFLIAVNGADTRQIFDGTAWTTSPSITATGAAPFSHVWIFKNRPFFVESGTLNAWYLDPQAIGGTATKFPLGGIFRFGGTLLFGATWSYESQGGGLNDACVFVTTEGEAAVYEGTDPSSVSTWALKGVYRIGRPLGKNASFKAGGDLAIATDDGLVSISQALVRDQAALAANAVSYPIEQEWRLEATQRRTAASWSIALWPTKQMAIVAMPTYLSLSPICFVVNIRTGAWGRYTGWDTRCLGMMNNRMFFGTGAGTIMEAETGGTDDGATYTASMLPLFEDFGDASAVKYARMVRPTVLTTVNVSTAPFVAADYVTALPSAPSPAPSVPSSSSAWGVAKWGRSKWEPSRAAARRGEWASVNGAGRALAAGVQISVSSAASPSIELVSLDLLYERGGIAG